jgi:hypothetical protein
MNKKVYTVKGSEDGILGVYTSVIKAWRRAKEYCLVNYKEEDLPTLDETKAIFRDHDWMDMGDGFGMAEIEAHYLNQ